MKTQGAIMTWVNYVKDSKKWEAIVLFETDQDTYNFSTGPRFDLEAEAINCADEKVAQILAGLKNVQIQHDSRKPNGAH